MTSMAIPSHVPPDRVRQFSWYGWQDESGDPALTLSHRLQDERLFYLPAGDRNPFGVWVLTRYDDIRRVLLDTNHFTSHHIAGWNTLAGVDELLIPVELDPPDLNRYRTFMSKFFARSELEKMRPAMRAASRAAIEAVATKGRMDIAPYCYKMTAGAWCALMGIEFSEVDRYIDYLWGMLHQYDYSVRFATARRMLDASKDLYEKNLGRSSPGLFNAFINCSIEGARPSASQCTGFILFQLLAGLDTMGTTAAWTLHHLASRPALQERLAHDSDAIPKFMEEMFRRYAILATNRFVRKDYEIDGVILKAGDNVLLSAAFACMDSHHFQCPAEVHPGRPEPHLAFGAGPHFCIGAPMARVQLPIFLEEWLRRIPKFRHQRDAKIRAHTGDLTGLDSLPIEWNTG
jgi:cytochrome P450